MSETDPAATKQQRKASKNARNIVKAEAEKRDAYAAGHGLVRSQDPAADPDRPVFVKPTVTVEYDGEEYEIDANAQFDLHFIDAQMREDHFNAVRILVGERQWKKFMAQITDPDTGRAICITNPETGDGPLKDFIGTIMAELDPTGGQRV